MKDHCYECGRFTDTVTVHPSDDAKDDMQLCVPCATKAGYIECPKCREWDSRHIRGHHIICKWCVDDLVIKHEREQGYQQRAVTA